MTHGLGRHAPLAVGVGALAAAVLLGLLQGTLLAIGRKQLVLLLVGGAALFASLPAVQRSLRALLGRSREAAPATRAMLRRHPGLYVFYSLWFALLASAGEILYWFSEKALGYRAMGFHFMWKIPLGYAVIFVACGLVFFVIARRWPDRVFLSALTLACAFIGFSGWLFLVRGLHEAAVLVLATGLAVQFARVAAGHPYLFHRVFRRTMPALAVLVIGLGAGFYAWPRWQEHRAIAQLPAAAPRSPNVLFMVLDTVRAKSLSLHGYARATTPNLDRFAARGVVFDRALSTSPWTLPSHGSMFSGRFPHELSGDWMVPIDATHPMLAEVFTGHGYLTGGFVANIAYCRAEFGLGRGFVHYEDQWTSMTTAMRRTSFGFAVVKALNLQNRRATREYFDSKSAEQVNRDFLRWLSTRASDRPYFVFLNYFDAHAPYLAPAEFTRKFSPTPPRGDLWSRSLDAWSPAEIRELNDAYDGAIAYLDHHLGRLFDELERRGALANTLVVVTSDHGEQFGEHDLVEHSTSLYLPLLHVPLVIVYPPRVPAGRRTDAFVSLRDLPATILDLTGLADPVGFPGASLAAFWRRPLDTPPRTDEILLAETQRARDRYPDHYPARKGPMKSILFRTMHYIKNYGDGREELYDLVRDPEQQQDLSGTAPHLVQEYRTYLERMTPGVKARAR